MELKLTTKRALAYEARTGKDLLERLGEIAKLDEIKVRDVVELFSALGDGYDVDKFEEWDLPLKDKIIIIMQAIREYTEGKK